MRGVVADLAVTTTAPSPIATDDGGAPEAKACCGAKATLTAFTGVSPASRQQRRE
jgi:hypothetical protein